jgi:hypothetical protein
MLIGARLIQHSAFLTPLTGPRSTSQTSPLLLHWAYLAASIYLQIIWVHGVDEQLGPLEILKTKLKVMSSRWLVAGTLFQLTFTLVIDPIHNLHTRYRIKLSMH